MTTTKLDIFSYTDYRGFLADRLDEMKAQNRKFSRRYFIKRLGLANSNYLKMIIDGCKPLSKSLVAKLEKELGLGSDEAAFFSRLVRFGQAKTSLEKTEALEEMRHCRRFVNVHQLALQHFDYLTSPLALALREIVVLPEFQESPEWIASRLTFKAKPREIEAMLHQLLDMGLLVRDGNGRLQQSQPHQSTGPQWGNVSLRAYHRKMLELASDSIDQPVQTRSFSGLSFAMNDRTYPKILERYAAFLDEVRALIENERDWNGIYHLEAVLFPLSHFPTDGGKP